MSIFEKSNIKNVEDLYFRGEKKKAQDFIDRSERGKEKKEAPIDEGIRSLVLKLNRLSFLFTRIGSCEGHVVGRKDIIKKYPNSSIQNLRLPEEGTAKYYPGYFHIKIDWSDASKDFLENLKLIIAQFPDSSIEVEFDTESGFNVSLDRQDKNDQYFSEEEARSFEAKGKELIKEIETLVDKYIAGQ